MAGLIRKSLDSPEETRPFEDGKGKLELVNLEGVPVGRATFEPGWQWSKHVAVMAPGHDAWIIGDEPCVVIDWQGFADYAKR